MKLLFHLLGLLCAFCLGWWLHGEKSSRQKTLVAASTKVNLSRCAIEVDKLEGLFRNGKFFSNKDDFIKLFAGYPIYKHPDSGQLFPCPFEDRVKCENYTVTLVNESLESGALPFMRNEVIYGENLERIFKPKLDVLEEDVATGLFQALLTAGFDRKSGVCQWWYFWFSM